MDEITKVNEIISFGGNVNNVNGIGGGGGGIGNGNCAINNSPPTSRRPTMPIFNSSPSNSSSSSSSSSQKDFPSQPKRSKTLNRPLSILTKQETKKNWQQMFFFQQKQNSMSPTNSAGKKFGLWLNKAMENFRLEEANGWVFKNIFKNIIKEIVYTHTLLITIITYSLY